MNETQNEEQKKLRAVLWLMMPVLLVVMVLNAWVGDDIYITMRTVWNAVHGEGLTWNPGERVQAFTHPLWMLVLTAAYAVTGEGYFTLIVLNLLFSLVAVYLLLRHAASLSTLLLGTALLVLSKAFMDYTTSGLENPLSYLLIILIIDRACSGKAFAGAGRIILLSMLVALLICTRMDLGLIVFPFYLYSWLAFCFKNPRKIPALIGWSIIGFAPLWGWELFSLIYYGFLFPNTAYAKLNTGITSAAYMAQGLAYYLTAIETDAVSILALLLGMAVAFHEKKKPTTLIVLGIVLYLLYLLKIGGDFMATRLLSVPVFAVTALVVRQTAFRRSAVYAALGVVLVLGLLNPYSPCRTNSNGNGFALRENGIADERTAYFKQLGMLNYSRERKMPDNHRWYQEGLRFDPETRVYLSSAVGLRGFAARGKDIYIVDSFALGNALLARLPVSDTEHWRIGHFVRSFPAGYVQTLTTGTNVIQPRSLRTYYTHLTNIISGPVFRASRFKDILNMNLGRYDELLKGTHIPGYDFSTFVGEKYTPEEGGDAVLASREGCPGGYLAFGVYREIKPGDYQTVFRVKPISNHPQKIDFQVATDRGAALLANKIVTFSNQSNEFCEIVLPFSIDKKTEIEPRILCVSNAALEVYWCNIDPIALIEP